MHRIKLTESIDAQDARANLAREAGREARAKRLPRDCPHIVTFLRAAWFAGYDSIKPMLVFRWSDSHRASSDDRTTAARIIRAHRRNRGDRDGKAFVRYSRATHRIEVGIHGCDIIGIWTRL